MGYHICRKERALRWLHRIAGSNSLRAWNQLQATENVKTNEAVVKGRHSPTKLHKRMPASTFLAVSGAHSQMVLAMLIC